MVGVTKLDTKVFLLPRSKKEKYLHEGYFHAENGNIKEARKSFQKSFSVTEDMIYSVIRALDEINVQHIVAPYDVGPQLAYMEKFKQVSAIVTEDSELLAFGCNKIIYRLDRQGNGKSVRFDDIVDTEELGIKEFTRDMFRYMCITTGCSYLSSISVAGINRARELVKNNPTIEKLFRALKNRFSTNITEPYMKGFKQADAAFLYQYVFDIDSLCYDRLNPFPKNLNVASFYLLGQDPQNRYISILRSNNAHRYPKFDSCDNLQKNTSLQTEEEDLDELEFDTANDLTEENPTEVKPISSTQSTKPQPPRPILIPKSVRRTGISNNSYTNAATPSTSNTTKISFSLPGDENKYHKNSRPACDAHKVGRNQSKVYPTVSRRTSKTNQLRTPKRKLLTLDDALPRNKITKLEDEDPFGLGLDDPL
ncbi:unnamed protein product [Mucor hiemalis]